MSDWSHFPPIPEGRTPNWETVHAVPIRETDETLVPLSLAPERILVRPAYYQAGLPGTFPECYAREDVLDRLLHAASLLPVGVRMVVLDGWRSTRVQEVLYEQCLSVLRTVHAEFAEGEVRALVDSFVARPSTDPVAPSPHLTGGAVDLTLADMHGHLLKFGTPFDYPGAASHTRYLEQKQEEGLLTVSERDALTNRRLLYGVMTRAGFVNLHSEWWHFEYGTQRWAFLTGAPHAVYGPANRSSNSFATFLQDAQKEPG